jgi:hypothetical protein
MKLSLTRKSKISIAAKPFTKKVIVNKQKHWHIILAVGTIGFIVMLVMNGYIFLALSSGSLFQSEAISSMPVTSLNVDHLEAVVDILEIKEAQQQEILRTSPVDQDPALF